MTTNMKYALRCAVLIGIFVALAVVTGCASQPAEDDWDASVRKEDRRQKHEDMAMMTAMCNRAGGVLWRNSRYEEWRCVDKEAAYRAIRNY